MEPKFQSTDITIAVPAFGRPNELSELLESILAAPLLPAEVLICEDLSPQRAEIVAACESKAAEFFARGASLRLVLNPENLGYDGNLRNIFQSSRTKYTMLLGDDDAILPNCIQDIVGFLNKNPTSRFVSRTFARFEESPNRLIGFSRLFDEDCIRSDKESNGGLAFRMSGFVGGLTIDTQWANCLATRRFDGTLYYQFYLACHAFCTEGIGYISSPIVAGRSGNPPLFGSSESEKNIHLPGAYRPAARANMWQSAARIAAEVGTHYGKSIKKDVITELNGRQLFHVYEMLSSFPRGMSLEMHRHLREIEFPVSWIGLTLLSINILMGSKAIHAYRLIRKYVQQ